MATFRFTIPAAAINAHSPAIPNPTAPWTGVRFADSVGIWFHTRSNATTTYGADGYLTNLRYNEFHWLDGSNLNTMVTPEPMSLAALGMGAAALLRRKKK